MGSDQNRPRDCSKDEKDQFDLFSILLFCMTDDDKCARDFTWSHWLLQHTIEIVRVSNQLSACGNKISTTKCLGHSGCCWVTTLCCVFVPVFFFPSHVILLFAPFLNTTAARQKRERNPSRDDNSVITHSADIFNCICCAKVFFPVFQKKKKGLTIARWVFDTRMFHGVRRFIWAEMFGQRWKTRLSRAILEEEEEEKLLLLLFLYLNKSTWRTGHITRKPARFLSKNIQRRGRGRCVYSDDDKAGDAVMSLTSAAEIFHLHYHSPSSLIKVKSTDATTTTMERIHFLRNDNLASTPSDY